jgi:uncharacterized protein YjbI with pentapeptide repeats
MHKRSHVELRHVELRHTELRHVELRHVELRHVELRHVELRHVVRVKLQACKHVSKTLIHLSKNGCFHK